MSVTGEPSFRESVDLMFNRAVALMDLGPGLEQKIRVCNSTYTVRFGVRLRGKIETFTGYRSVHSEHMEPVKGGIRYKENVTFSFAVDNLFDRTYRSHLNYADFLCEPGINIKTSLKVSL